MRWLWQSELAMARQMQQKGLYANEEEHLLTNLLMTYDFFIIYMRAVTHHVQSPLLYVKTPLSKN